MILSPAIEEAPRVLQGRINRCEAKSHFKKECSVYLLVRKGVEQKDAVIDLGGQGGIALFQSLWLMVLRDVAWLFP